MNVNIVMKYLSLNMLYKLLMLIIVYQKLWSNKKLSLINLLGIMKIKKNKKKFNFWKINNKCQLIKTLVVQFVRKKKQNNNLLLKIILTKLRNMKEIRSKCRLYKNKIEKAF